MSRYKEVCQDLEKYFSQNIERLNGQRVEAIESDNMIDLRVGGKRIGTIFLDSDDEKQANNILGTCGSDCNTDDAWKGDLTEAAADAALTTEEEQEMDGKEFGGCTFADEFFC